MLLVLVAIGGCELLPNDRLVPLPECEDRMEVLDEVTGLVTFVADERDCEPTEDQPDGIAFYQPLDADGEPLTGDRYDGVCYPTGVRFLSVRDLTEPELTFTPTGTLAGTVMEDFREDFLEEGTWVVAEYIDHAPPNISSRDLWTAIFRYGEAGSAVDMDACREAESEE